MENKIHGYVYLITNLINGKQYVGQTTSTIIERFDSHYYSSKKRNLYIDNTIRKYGRKNFKIEEIDIAHNQKELNKLEGLYIIKYNTLAPNGYNLKGFIDGKGFCSKYTKLKMKDAQNKPERLKLQREIGKKSRGIRRKNAKSKYCGVSLLKEKYISRITLENKIKNLGTYNYETDAAKAYDIAAIKYFGEDAKLNFPELKIDYINCKITVNKNIKIYPSVSGEKGILFIKNRNRWQFVWFNKSLNKKKTKLFKTLEEAIEFKLNNKN